MARGPDRTKTYESSAPSGDHDFPAPYLVVGFECTRPMAGSSRHALSEIDEVVVGRGDPRQALRETDTGRGRLRIKVPDSWMSSEHARFRIDSSRWIVEDCESKNGTFVNGGQIEQHELEDGDLVEIGNTMFLFRQREPRAFRESPDVEIEGHAIDPRKLITLSTRLDRKLEALARVAPSEVPVLLHGETGTGKEVTARWVHAASGRTGEMVAINCGALAPNLVESELFGYKKGAFSGANEDRAGLVRAADGGTLFLDEIAELPEAVQVKLLRVLQEKEVIPVGDTRATTVDIRVIAATHQNLADLVAGGSFREDLYSRLAGFELELPPLRARREDLGLLVPTLLRRILGDEAGEVTFQRSAGRALYRYHWPLNIRELEQALTAATALAAGEPIALSHLPPGLRPSATRSKTLPRSDDEVMARRLDELLRTHRGNVSAVAREMDKARIQIRRWCKRFGLDPKKYR